MSIADASAAESGSVTFNVTLSAASRKTVTVTASTAAASPISAAGVAFCVAGDGSDDYQTNSMSLLFVAGTVTAPFAVTVCDDTAPEPDETFAVTLTGASNTVISSSGGDAVGTIIDNDAPLVTIHPVWGDCPAGQHLHDDGTGPYCHSDETTNVPDCARVPQHYIVHDAADPDNHLDRIVDPCPPIGGPCPPGVTCVPPTTDCASADMHFHGSDPDISGTYCHIHDPTPQSCHTGLRLFWRSHSGGAHTDEITLACPPPEPPPLDDSSVLLFGPSGIRLQFTISVDTGAVNPHAEPAREFRVYTTNDACLASAVDCAVPYTHYDPVLKDEDGNDLTTLSFNSDVPQTVYLHTLVDLDHGTGTRLLRIIVQDTHILRGHVNIDLQAQLQPPLRGTN